MSHAACESQALPNHRGRNGNFWAKVIKTDCCWLWARAKAPGTRYGVFWKDGKLHKAHRYAYEQLVGPIPDGLDLMHDCDVRHCVRPGPGHARPGTHAENMHDMVVKGRNAPQDGERNHHAKFNWDQIHDIRARAALGEPAALLAAEYSTSSNYISRIVTFRVWPEPPTPAEAIA